MGCHGSKTAQASKPVEQQPADTTLLKEPAADSQVVKPQESVMETPQALAKETPMDASQDAAAPQDAKIGATQDAETSKTAEIPTTQDAAASKAAETPAAQEATQLIAAEAPTSDGDMASKAEEAPATQEGATSNDVETPAELEAASATPPDAANKPAEGTATANDEVSGGKQIFTAEASEQKPESPEPKVEAGAAQATPVQNLAGEGASADQAKAADPTAAAKQDAIGTQANCCSRYCVATEVQSEIVVQKD